MTPKNLFSERIKRERERKGLTLEQVARSAGVAYNTARDVERGENVRLHNLLDVAAVVGIELRPVRVRIPKPTNKLKVTSQ